MELIARLQDSLPHSGFASAKVEQAWTDEAERQADQVERGEMGTLSHEELIARL